MILNDFEKSDYEELKKLVNSLSESNNVYIKEALVDNDYCPVYILEKVADKEEDEDVIAKICLNEKCPIHILEKFSNYKSNYIKASVLSNKNCSIEILEKLSNEDYEIVRVAVVKNENCPYYILKKLYKNNRDVYSEEYDEEYLNLITSHPNWKLNEFQ